MSTDLVVPSGRELEALSPADRWNLEDALDEAQDTLREFNDKELRHWVEAEGKTLAAIGEVVGRSTSQVQRRIVALGLRTQSKRGRPRISPTGNSNGEVIDAEAVEDVSESGAPSDPGPRVKCPTCGHMVKPDDIGTWRE